MAEAQSPEQERRKFTVDEVMRVVSAGIIDEDDRVELIEGELYLMSPQDPPRAGTTGKLTMLLTKIYADGYAAAGVPVYWRLDLPRRRLEVHEAPDGQGTYTLLRVLDEGAEVAFPGLSGTQSSVKVAGLLPARH